MPTRSYGPISERLENDLSVRRVIEIMCARYPRAAAHIFCELLDDCGANAACLDVFQTAFARLADPRVAAVMAAHARFPEPLLRPVPFRNKSVGVGLRPGWRAGP